MNPRLLLSFAALLLCACSGPEASGDSAIPSGEPTAGAPAPPAAAPAGARAPAPAAEPAPLPSTPRPGRGSGKEPTAADSATAAAKDVSPEWVANSRKMESYQSCMAKAAGIPEAARARIAAACSRLPTAPR